MINLNSMIWYGNRLQVQYWLSYKNIIKETWSDEYLRQICGIMHVAVFHIPVFRFRSVHRTAGAEHTGDFSAFQILRRHKPCLRTPESAGTIPLAAGKSQLKNRSPDTAVLRRRRRKLCCAAGSDSVSCSFCGIPPQSGFPPLHPFLYETLSRQGRSRILKKQKEHSAIPVYKYRIAETAVHQFRIP